jgi:hypothetical protein
MTKRDNELIELRQELDKCRYRLACLQSIPNLQKKLWRWAMAIVEVKRFPEKEVFAEAEAVLKELSITDGKIDGYWEEFRKKVSA